MGKLDQLLESPNRSPSPTRRKCFNDKETGQFEQECLSLIYNVKGPPIIIRQIIYDSMFCLNASMNGLTVQAEVIKAAEITLVLDQVAAQLPKQALMLEMVFEWNLLN
ncbi:hypothetical protein DPMN_074280 [Dreissena polymorpha]|uniref:Uncharacterized protein n=1 Tax=Dreissena polymorpha TaxID=45954 RepID=A0A9D3YIB2_DREPO|nr:hypothetical protein DPMN_074280 [Dreissena polymorpha]